MKTLGSNRALGALAMALVLTGCAQNEETRPRLLTVDQARISAVDPVVLMSEMARPAVVDSDVDLLHVACFVPPQPSPQLADGECVASQPNGLRID